MILWFVLLASLPKSGIVEIWSQMEALRSFAE